MSANRKKPGVAFWGAVALALLALYMLSGGIHEFLWRRGMFPTWADGAADWYFAPTRWLYQNLPQWYRDAYDRFLKICRM